MLDAQKEGRKIHGWQNLCIVTAGTLSLAQEESLLKFRPASKEKMKIFQAESLKIVTLLIAVG